MIYDPLYIKYKKRQSLCMVLEIEGGLSLGRLSERKQGVNLWSALNVL